MFPTENRENHKISRYQSFSETRSGSVLKFFDIVRQKISLEARDTPSLAPHSSNHSTILIAEVF